MITPKPWKARFVDPDGGWDCARIVTSGGKRNRIAVCTRVQQVDDAYLIAAAPELLEALKKAVDRQGFTNQELIEAREAIAKAKGEG